MSQQERDQERKVVDGMFESMVEKLFLRFVDAYGLAKTDAERDVATSSFQAAISHARVVRQIAWDALPA